MDRPIASRLRRTREQGFTLIELMTVMAIMAVLVGIALPNYRISIVMAREAVLLENLTTLRRLVTQYQSDKGYGPQSLQALVDEGMLKQIPKDPMTGKDDWEVEYGEPDESGKAAGIEWVRSSSTANSLSKGPYNEW